MKNSIGVALLLTLLNYGWSTGQEQGQNVKPASKSDSLFTLLQGDVVKIFTKNCSVSGCHSGAYPKKKLTLEEKKMSNALIDVPSLQIDSLKLVDTQQPEKSYLLMKIRGDQKIVDSRMPIDAPPLKENEIKTIETWAQHVTKQKMPPEKPAKVIKKDKSIR